MKSYNAKNNSTCQVRRAAMKLDVRVQATTEFTVKLEVKFPRIHHCTPRRYELTYKYSNHAEQARVEALWEWSSRTGQVKSLQRWMHVTLNGTMTCSSQLHYAEAVVFTGRGSTYIWLPDIFLIFPRNENTYHFRLVPVRIYSYKNVYQILQSKRCPFLCFWWQGTKVITSLSAVAYEGVGSVTIVISSDPWVTPRMPSKYEIKYCIETIKECETLNVTYLKHSQVWLERPVIF